MDSGNSSSMQSSSGGDEQEYDSRSLFNQNMSMNMNMMMLMKPPAPPPQQQQQQNQQPVFSWAPPPLMRPDPNTNFLSFTSAPGSSSAPPPVEPPSQPQHPPPPPKNPKKRTRASRRAPTTVLTTDTSNFRAMVQEFTGIPDPPFSGSACSRRLDLLSSAGSSMRLAAASFGPPFRPAPQRLVINQDPLPPPGSDTDTLAFQTLIQQQSLLFPPPQPPFGMNMGMAGLFSPSQPGNGVGFGSSSGPDHAGTSNPNNDYVTSQNDEYHNN